MNQTKEKCPKCQKNNTQTVHMIVSSFIFCNLCKEDISKFKNNTEITLNKNSIEHILNNSSKIPILLSGSGEYVPNMIKEYANKYNKIAHIISTHMSMAPIAVQISRITQKYTNQIIVFEDIESFTPQQLDLIKSIKQSNKLINIVCFADKIDFKHSPCQSDVDFVVIE